MRDYPEAIALVAAMLEKAKKRAETIEGALELMTGEERDLMFKMVATPGTPYTIEGIAKAAAIFIILDPKDR
jgi:hypothetical protein